MQTKSHIWHGGILRFGIKDQSDIINIENIDPKCTHHPAEAVVISVIGETATASAAAIDLVAVTPTMHSMTEGGNGMDIAHAGEADAREVRTSGRLNAAGIVEVVANVPKGGRKRGAEEAILVNSQGAEGPLEACSTCRQALIPSSMNYPS